MSKRASTSSSPPRRSPSSATSAPETKASTSTWRAARSSAGRRSTLAASRIRASRFQATAKEAGSSARMTPRLAERSRGFTTQGYSTRRAGSSGPGARSKSQKGGTDTPAAASASLMACLLAARRAASGGLWGSPSFPAARAAMTAVPSSTGTTPRMGRFLAARAICSAARCGRR